MENFVKDFSGTTLKFGTNIKYDRLYCVSKNQLHIVYQSLYLSVFLSFQQFFHLISLASISATVFKLCTHKEDNQVYYYKQNQGAEIYFCLLFLFLAHLSRRLIGELIVYRSSRSPSVRPSVRLLTLSNMNISATSWLIRMKFNLTHYWGGGKAPVGFDPDWIRTLVSMATDSSHRVIMGKTASSRFLE